MYYHSHICEGLPYPTEAGRRGVAAGQRRGAPPEDARMDERFRGSVSHAYQAFHGELLRFLRKHLGSSADAADLAQDTFAQWLKWPGRQSVEQPRAFLSRSPATCCATMAPAAEPRPGSRPAGGERRTRRAGRRGGRAGRAFRTAAAPQPPGGRAGRAAAAARSVRPAQVRRPVPGRSGRAHGNLLSMVEKHIASALLHCKRRLGQGGEG